MKKKLELYIHTPFCVKKCSYCDFLSFPADEQTQEEYVEALLSEIAWYGKKMHDYEVATIYIGGGTPTWLTQELMLAILDGIGDNFTVRRDAEVTIECNPGTVTSTKLQSFRSAGVNRLSIGLQSTVDEELKLLGRIHTYEQFVKTYEMARNADFTNINIDLISGLPHQTLEDFSKSVQNVIRLRPEHISVYALMIEKGTPFYDEYKFDAVRQEAGLPTEALPSEDEAYRMYKMAQYTLKEAGYEQYEISNYARKGYACQHNIGYWTRVDYLGLGLGAASLIDNVRYSNTRDLYEYINGAKDIRSVPLSEFLKESEQNGKDTAYPANIALQRGIATSLHALAEPVTRKAQMEEFMFLGLRMNAGVARADFERAFGMQIEAVYRRVMEELKEQGLLIASGGRIALTDRGMDLSNYVMRKFLQ